MKEAEKAMWPSLNKVLNKQADDGRPSQAEGVDLSAVSFHLQQEGMPELMQCLQAPRLDEHAHKLSPACGELMRLLYPIFLLLPIPLEDRE